MCSSRLVSSFLYTARRYFATGVLPFSELYRLPSLVVENLHKQGLIYPTEIQEKSLNSLLDSTCDSRCAVINAETGSGKTLCFLLPVLSLFGKLWQETGSIPTAAAAVLVPSPHLAQQVSDVFWSLAHPHWNISIAAFHHSKFSFTKDSHLLIGIPGKLQNYYLNTLFANNKILCLDEADILLTGGEGVITKKILKYVLNVHELELKKHCESSEQSLLTKGEESKCQPRTRVILTAATLPSNGPQTVGKQLLRLLPKDSIMFFKTESTHKTLPNADLNFISCKDIQSKFLQLEKDLYALGNNTSHFEEPKVLIFANTAENASTLVKFLCTLDTNSLEEGQSKWWLGKVGLLSKQPGVLKEDIGKVMEDFRNGSLRVLVCTDLGSRGLDFPDCNVVIQFDFPENAEFFLHRAGRTARRGQSGVVLSYVCKSDVDIAQEIQKVVSDRSKSFDSVFSRNKMLRRKIKRRKKIQAET